MLRWHCQAAQSQTKSEAVGFCFLPSMGTRLRRGKQEPTAFLLSNGAFRQLTLPHKLKEENSMRGFSAIGLFNPKTPANVGSVLRAAYCYKSAMVAMTGSRFKRAATDTMTAWRHLPLIETNDLLAGYIKTLEAERDRYKIALSRIASDYEDACDKQAVARDALA